MPTRATGTFEIDGWDAAPHDDRAGTQPARAPGRLGVDGGGEGPAGGRGGAKLARVRVAKTFHGDVEGISTTDLLLAYGAEEGSAAYVGFERLVGNVHGRFGSFVLHHT